MCLVKVIQLCYTIVKTNFTCFVFAKNIKENMIIINKIAPITERLEYLMYGNVMVGQSGGPTAAINASLCGVVQTALSLGCKTIYGMLYGIQGLLNGKYVNLSERLSDSLNRELLKQTPSSYLGSCRKKLPDAAQDETVYQKIFQQLDVLNIEFFFYIGGNDSMDTILKLSDYGKQIGSPIRFMGVPKTIDNDLMCTDHTPGYGSAAKYIAASVKELICDGLVYDMESVTITEIMGRNAGWLTAAASLAEDSDCCGPDMIFLPETPFDINRFIEQTAQRLKEKKSLVIAVSEGIKSADGIYICEQSDNLTFTDSFGHKILAGAARVLTHKLTAALGCKTRAVELNTLQRCASHFASYTDITEATAVGGFAVKAALQGNSGCMSHFERVSSEPYQCICGISDIHNIANAEKTVPVEWIDTEKNAIKNEFITYARPLIQGEISPIVANGLPRHLPPLR